MVVIQSGTRPWCLWTDEQKVTIGKTPGGFDFQIEKRAPASNQALETGHTPGKQCAPGQNRGINPEPRNRGVEGGHKIYTLETRGQGQKLQEE